MWARCTTRSAQSTILMRDWSLGRSKSVGCWALHYSVVFPVSPTCILRGSRTITSFWKPLWVSQLHDAVLFWLITSTVRYLQSCAFCIWLGSFKYQYTLHSFIQLGHFVCIISTLWTMTVSTYGDPSQLRVLPLAADLAIPLSAFTAFIVQVNGLEFISIICILQVMSVILRISTLEVVWKSFLAYSLRTNFCCCTNFYTHSLTESVWYDRPHGFWRQSNSAYYTLFRRTRSLWRNDHHWHRLEFKPQTSFWL